MRKYILSPRGIAAEAVLLLLVMCLWYFQAADKVGDEAVRANGGHIKWVEFNVTIEALNHAYKYDVDTYGKDVHLNWVELLAYLGAKYGGDFQKYKDADMDEAAGKIVDDGISMEELSGKMKYYPYYLEAYDAVLGGMVGKYEIEDEGHTGYTKKYGLKGYHPIAKGFPYGDYDDFGVSRSYGYKRNHLGHDMMGQVGTPVRMIVGTILKGDVKLLPVKHAAFYGFAY